MAGFCWKPTVRSAGLEDETNAMPSYSANLNNLLRGGDRYINTTVNYYSGFGNLIQNSKQINLIRALYALTMADKPNESVHLVLTVPDLMTADTLDEHFVSNMLGYIKGTTHFYHPDEDIKTIHVIHARAGTISKTRELYAALPATDYKNICTSVSLTPAHLVHISVNKNVCTIITNLIGPGVVLRILAVLGFIYPAFLFEDRSILGMLAADDIEGLVACAETLYNVWFAEKDTRLKRGALQDIVNNFGQIAEKKCNNNIQNVQRDITSRLDSLKADYQRLDSLQKQMFAILYCKGESGANPMQAFMDYAMRKPQIESIRVLNMEYSKISMKILVPCSNFQTEAVAILAKNKTLNNFSSDVRMAFHKIFTEQAHTLWFTSNIVLDLEDGSLDKKTDEFCTRGVPNPHFYYYTCFGNNATPIRTAIKKQNYEAAIEQILASAGSLNFYDGVTAHIMEVWNKQNDARYVKPKCISLTPEGPPVYNWPEYIAYLHEQEELAKAAIPLMPEDPTPPRREY